jgi:hypothetical protein
MLGNVIKSPVQILLARKDLGWFSTRVPGHKTKRKECEQLDIFGWASKWKGEVKLTHYQQNKQLFWERDLPRASLSRIPYTTLC